jgi:hypothetical protein
MSLTTEQCRSLVNEVAAAPSISELATLRLEARRAGMFDVRGSFLEVLMGLREHRLSQPARDDHTT